jgi:lipase chaperone LimK
MHWKTQKGRHVSTKKWIIISVAAGLAIVAVLAATKPKPVEQAAKPGQSGPGLITAQVPTGIPDTPAESAKAPFAASAPQVAASPLDSIAPPACRTTARGDLVIDPQTREDVELVTSLHKPADALAKLNEACKNESPKAQQEMKNLLQQFVQYSQAVVQTFPPEEQIAIPVDKLEAVLHKGLHDLRVQYFGAEKACAMYCEEEEITKRMLGTAVDYKQKNPKASTEEAVGFAQSELSKELEAKAKQQAAQASSVK